MDVLLDRGTQPSGAGPITGARAGRSGLTQGIRLPRLPVRFTAGLVLALVCELTLAAQVRPTFSGRWVVVTERSVGVADAPRSPVRDLLFGEDITIKQDAATLTVSQAPEAVGRGPSVLMFKLDGSDNRNASPSQSGSTPTWLLSRAAWQGDKLTIATTLEFEGAGGISLALPMFCRWMRKVVW
jgi:hypothetical protein